ncbi:MAG: hypothetical protein ACOYCD_08755 [Kiritimatiellia bacterium]
MKHTIHRIQTIVCRWACSGLALAAVCVWAADDPSANAALPDLAPETTPPAEERDPFWPIGYTPPREMSGEAAPGQPGTEVSSEVQVDNEVRAKLREMLRAGGVIKKGRVYYASVNGQMVQVGDIIALPHAGRVYRFRIDAIEMHNVRIKPLD